MEFPIVELLDHKSSISWLSAHFHPKGVSCPDCEQPAKSSRTFRHTKKSDLIVYRCTNCSRTYNLYTGTSFEGSHWSPMQVILFLRGICKGETTNELSAELELSYRTVLRMRHKIQSNAEKAQPNTPLPDIHSETDEMFQNAGEKRGTTS